MIETMGIDIPISYTIISSSEGSESNLKIVSTAQLPTIFGDFILLGIKGFEDGKEHVVLVRGDVTEKSELLTRVHSECLTSEVLGSLRCDCREQLHESLKLLAENDEGILIYLRQEGRGIGLLNKIRAYELQDGGFNTLEANRMLGFDDDLRDFAVAANILKLLKIGSIRLITNNPRKIKGLEGNGISITERIPIIIQPNQYNRKYLETKKKLADHLLEFSLD